MSNLKWTGERVIPDMMQEGESPEHQAHLDRILKEHITRYNWARRFCLDKLVLDASCGSGYGTRILGDVATEAYGVDIDINAIDYAWEKYSNKKVTFNSCDLSKHWITRHINYQVIVSFETIEHLENPNIFLNNVKEHFTEKFIFSIPLNNASEFHKVVYTCAEAMKMIDDIFEEDSDTIAYYTQDMEKITRGINENSRFILGVISKK